MTKPVSLRASFARTALKLAEQDDSIVVLVGDISHGIFAEFRARFPNRYFNVGILEPAMASIAAGISMMGLKPIVHTIAPFLVERSFEQLKLDFGYQKLPAIFVSVGGAFDYSNLGCTHHSYIDLPLVASIEGTRVLSPSSESELEDLMSEAIASWDESLFYFKLTENGNDKHSGLGKSRIGQPEKLTDGDSGMAIVSLGPSVVQAAEAVKILSESGFGVTHINIHTYKPINLELLDQQLGSATNVLVVEHVGVGMGLSGQLQNLLFRNPKRQFNFQSIAGFVRDYGTYQDLLVSSKLDAKSLAGSLLKMKQKTKG